MIMAVKMAMIGTLVDMPLDIVSLRKSRDSALSVHLTGLTPRRVSEFRQTPECMIDMD
jgi:hypothetical protein